MTIFQVCGGAHTEDRCGHRDSRLYVYNQWKKARVTNSKYIYWFTRNLIIARKLLKKKPVYVARKMLFAFDY